MAQPSHLGCRDQAPQCADAGRGDAAANLEGECLNLGTVAAEFAAIAAQPSRARKVARVPHAGD
eukprot:9652212-Lingulodinium_polyedra.AAC.1